MAQTDTNATHSYRQIVKASALIGGSSVANIAIGIVRTKVMALLLGPAGVGLAGLYGAISDITLSVAGMGVNNSGVRQIAEAAGSDDAAKIARTAHVLRRASLYLGAIGAALLLVFSRQVSTVTFGSDRHSRAVSLLAIAVFFRLVSAGQGALINGMRRISDLAKMNVLGALSGTVIGIPLVYWLREDGIVPSLIAVAAMMILTSWWYSRKIQLPPPTMTMAQVSAETAALLKLGFAFMASSLMTIGAAYLVRIIIRRDIGFEATGLYQSAWTLGGLYVGFILQAMGADFYPRLTASANDNTACNRMVNEQARVGLLLGGPGVIATLTLAPLVIGVFYSAKFYAAVELLRWICLGVTLRVITWPLGFIILAKGRQTIFFWSELAWTIVNVSLTFLCIGIFGLKGAGIAFFGSYLFHGCLIYTIVRRISAFRWSDDNASMGFALFALIAMVFCGFFVLPLAWAICLGTAASLLSGMYSLRTLLTLTPLDNWTPRIRYVLRHFRLRPASVRAAE